MAGLVGLLIGAGAGYIGYDASHRDKILTDHTFRHADPDRNPFGGSSLR